MYLMQTVSAVPRSRTYVDPPRVSMEANHVNCINEEKDMKLRRNDGYIDYSSGKMYNGVRHHDKENLLKNRNQNLDEIQVDNKREEEDKGKKKEKKWTLGGFFKRKCKKDADDTSEESEEETKGFLSRRRSKRDRRKAKTRNSTTGFDVIIQKPNPALDNIGKTAEELWSGASKVAKEPEPQHPVRYIHRNHNDFELKNKESLQIPKRRDSNLSKNSSGGSGSLDGRKGRKDVLARAEAKRDQMREESSSDEHESYHSSTSLNKDGSRRSRTSRTERYLKRLSRDEEVYKDDCRIVKSDVENYRNIQQGGRWTAKYYPDSSDYESMKYGRRMCSATPSPARSPRVRPKQVHRTPPIPTTYTFPPGCWQPGSPHAIHRTPPQQQPYIRMNYPVVYCPQQSEHPIYHSPTARMRNMRNAQYIPVIARSNSDHATNKRLLDYEQYLSACGRNSRSTSYDQDIHRASYFENEPDVMFVQLPLGKPVQESKEKPEPPPRDLRRINQPHKPMGVRVDSTSSLPIQQEQHSPFVYRSSSGNSFHNTYENTRDTLYTKSNSYQHLPTNYYQNLPIHDKPVYYTSDVVVDQDQHPAFNKQMSVSPKLPKHIRSSDSGSAFRYYADENPRSRNPIHITCTSEPSLVNNVNKSPQHPRKNPTSASEFWKKKELENIKSQAKPPSQRQGSVSPSIKDFSNVQIQKPKLCNPPTTYQTNVHGSSHVSSLVNRIMNMPEEVKKDVRSKEKDRLSVVIEKCESQEEVNKKEKMTNEVTKNGVVKQNNHLDEALDELEAIYKSLKLGDEDLLERAERRDLPVYKSKDFKEYKPPCLREKSKENGEKSDPVINHKTKSDPLTLSPKRQRAVPSRRSGVPDKVGDDMAFRRLNPKEKTEKDVKSMVNNVSYLLSSPALSPLPVGNISPSNSSEPDVMLDDVVFRNIRHVNNTLKTIDPQPPFGIPVGPVAPGANSDYLHAMPKERFRPTFTNTKTPDIVKDDLAFRNLRKDNSTNVPMIESSSPSQELLTNPNFLMQKKKAVRSLSANLYNIIQKDGFVPIETNNNNLLEKDYEKAVSLTDLSDVKEKTEAELRLQKLKQEKISRRAQFFEQRKSSDGRLSWTELANLNGDFENIPQVNTSTETLTGERENPKPKAIKLKGDDCKTRPPLTPERKVFRTPVVELSKYPAAAPASSLLSNPFSEVTPGSPLDEDQLEDLLSALAREAKNASEDLSRQLVELELATSPKPRKKFDTLENITICVANERKSKSRSNSIDVSRRRSLSRSNSNGKEERRSSRARSEEKQTKHKESKTESLEAEDNFVKAFRSSSQREMINRSPSSEQNVSKLSTRSNSSEKTTTYHSAESRSESRECSLEVARILSNDNKNDSSTENTKETSTTQTPASLDETSEKSSPKEQKTPIKEQKPTKETKTPTCHKIRRRSNSARKVSSGDITKNEIEQSIRKHRRRSLQTFEIVTDLSQILQGDDETKVQNKTNGKDMFQEVYEYNCKLPKQKEELEIIDVKKQVMEIIENRCNIEETNKNIDVEFDKLHCEMTTKDKQLEDVQTTTKDEADSSYNQSVQDLEKSTENLNKSLSNLDDEYDRRWPSNGSNKDEGANRQCSETTV